MFNPNIIETTGRSSVTYDLSTKFLQNRNIYLGEEIDSEVANNIVMQLLWLNSDNKNEEIDLYINSPGGTVTDGLAIKDIMHKIDAKVNTIGVGQCASMGAYLLSAGTGVRKATENCRIMIHSVIGGVQGSYHNIKNDFKEIEIFQDLMLRDITKFSKGKSTFEDIVQKTKLDWNMDIEEAIEFGLADEKI